MKMPALQIRCVAKEAIVKRLRSRLEEEANQLKKYKEGIRTMNGKVKALSEQVKKLDGASRRAEELTANATLMAEVTSL